VPVQYADYSAWLAGQAQSPQTAADLAYWAEHLSGLGELDLTYGRPRPGQPSGHGMALPVEIGTELAARIGELARQEHATPFMVLLAAYAWVLGRVFGSADVPVGMSVSTRTDPGVRDTVGMFVERVVLRADLSGRPSLRELVRRARLEVLAAHEHSQLGFDRIVEAAAPVRKYGVEPLAQASVNLQPAVPDAFAGSDIADGQFGNETVRHDLALDLTDGGSWYYGRLEFREGVVDPEEAHRVAALLGTVLHTGSRDPGRPLDEVAVVGGAELARLHASQDGGPVPGTGGADGMLDLVRRWVAQIPDALAVDAPDERLTYRELAARADAVARLLRARDVTAEEPVLVALPRIAALPVAFLGILAARACYVPVDPAAPAARLAAIADAVAARIVLVAPGSQPALPSHVTRVPVDVPENAAPLGDWQARPAAAAYTLFTSGSSGTPKGSWWNIATCSATPPGCSACWPRRPAPCTCSCSRPPSTPLSAPSARRLPPAGCCGWRARTRHATPRFWRSCSTAPPPTTSRSRRPT
jgi:non-ribosomal peptide synthetase component F